MPPLLNNIEIENNGSLLTLRINLEKKGEVSASGKSVIKASTHGNFNLGDEKGTILSLNVYQPIAKKKGLPAPTEAQ